MKDACHLNPVFLQAIDDVVVLHFKATALLSQVDPRRTVNICWVVYEILQCLFNLTAVNRKLIDAPVFESVFVNAEKVLIGFAG